MTVGGVAGETKQMITKRLSGLVLILLMSGCGCDGTVEDGPTDASFDGGADTGSCLPANLCAGGRICCESGEECVDDFACAPICDSVRCGDNNLTCCAAGQQCFEGVVCAAACDPGESLCGAALDTCCPAGDVCVDNACETPGTVCADDFDCLAEGTYCEGTIGRCLDNPAPPLCEVQPDFEDIDLAVEWHWPGLTHQGTEYNQVIASPAVGDVSGDGVPDVVVPVYTGSSGASTVLVALDGGTGNRLWYVPPGDGSPRWTAMVALGNLDPSDEALEIVYQTRREGLVVLDGDGSTVLAQFSQGSVDTGTVVSPALADLDGDGVIEVIAGCQVFSFEAAAGGWALVERFDAGRCDAPAQNFAAPAVADLDGDGDLEITTGAAAYNPDGSVLWPATGTPAHGRPAVADLDQDGFPEVISTRQFSGDGRMTIRAGATGAMLVGPGGSWFDAAIVLPGGGFGGAPTVADFDGDGFPEIATAGEGCYAVYDLDCLPTPPRSGGDCTRPPNDPASTCDDGLGAFVRWARPTQDVSSSVTGSSVFDFQGDGVSEVIYNDECFLHVYDGRDGRELLGAVQPNSSRTAVEYPLVVDVDRDGNSEIVVPANNDQAVTRDNCPASYAAALGIREDELPAAIAEGTQGVFVFGDPGDRWVRTRPIWNQFTYHVTHVTDLGDIPTEVENNWSNPELNNYRQNVQGAGVFNAPNLTVTLDVVARCGRGGVRLSAVVTNAGSRGVAAGVSLDFEQLAPSAASIAGAVTQRALLPGASERVTVDAEGVTQGEQLEFRVTVDGAGASSAVIECTEDDNQALATEECPILI